MFNKHRITIGEIAPMVPIIGIANSDYNFLTKEDHARNEFFFYEVRDRLNHLIGLASGEGSMAEEYAQCQMISQKWVSVDNDCVTMMKPYDSFNKSQMYCIHVMHYATGIEFICSPLGRFNCHGDDDGWAQSNVADCWGIQLVNHIVNPDNAEIERRPMSIVLNTHVKWWNPSPVLVATSLFAKMDEYIDWHLSINERYAEACQNQTDMTTEEFCQKVAITTLSNDDGDMMECIKELMSQSWEFRDITRLFEAIKNKYTPIV